MWLITTSEKGLPCITFWPRDTADILNYSQRTRATHRSNNSCLYLLTAQVDPRSTLCSYGAFMLSKFNMSNRESTFQNERHSSNSVNKPFLNWVPFSRSRRVNSIRYFSNWLDTFQMEQFPSKSNKLNRLR